MTMEPKDFIAVAALIISALALFVAYKSYVRTGQHNLVMKNLASTAPELNLLGQATTARIRFDEILSELSAFAASLGSKKPNKAERSKIDDLEKTYKNAVEDMLGIYETACTLYLEDDTINKTRFRKLYQTKIRELVESGDGSETKKRIVSIPHKFPAILAVYDQWNKV